MTTIGIRQAGPAQGDFGGDICRRHIGGRVCRVHIPALDCVGTQQPQPHVDSSCRAVGVPRLADPYSALRRCCLGRLPEDPRNREHRACVPRIEDHLHCEHRTAATDQGGHPLAPPAWLPSFGSCAYVDFSRQGQRHPRPIALTHPPDVQGSDHRNAAASPRRLTTAGSAAGSASAAFKPRSARPTRRGHHGLAQGTNASKTNRAAATQRVASPKTAQLCVPSFQGDALHRLAQSAKLNTTRPSMAPWCMRVNTSLMFSSRSVWRIARPYDPARRCRR